MTIARVQALILIVDDEPDLVSILAQFLERVGYQVIATTSSTEAFSIFLKNPDQILLLLTDLTMPYLSGIDLAEKVKAIRPNIPVILCTGFGEDIGWQSAQTSQIAACLGKPVAREDLVAAVQRVLA